MTHRVNKTNKDGWEGSVQIFRGFPNQGNYIFQPLILIFLKCQAMRLSCQELWSENKIRGQMPKPSRNVMEKKQSKRFSLLLFS